jgi:N-acetyl-1-D-myo-inositol-2-amino-2-deoxy-alpha-D-glucopyranoside deacetylase
MAISKHTTFAYQVAGDPGAFPAQAQDGLQPYSPQRLFYVARPQGYRLERALMLREAGFDVPLPPPELCNSGVPDEQIHLRLDVSAYLETKLASMRCHRTQLPPDAPAMRLSQSLALAVHGTEYLIQAHPPAPIGATRVSNFLAGLQPDD